MPENILWQIKPVKAELPAILTFARDGHKSSNPHSLHITPWKNLPGAYRLEPVWACWQREKSHLCQALNPGQPKI